MKHNRLQKLRGRNVTSVETSGELPKKRLVPQAKIRFNIIPSHGQYVKVPMSVLLGPNTIRVHGVIKATIGNN
eukprot:6628358-Prorocentrum_lima.AAC.1